MIKSIFNILVIEEKKIIKIIMTKEEIIKKKIYNEWLYNIIKLGNNDKEII